MAYMEGEPWGGGLWEGGVVWWGRQGGVEGAVGLGCGGVVLVLVVWCWWSGGWMDAGWMDGWWMDGCEDGHEAWTRVAGGRMDGGWMGVKRRRRRRKKGAGYQWKCWVLVEGSWELVEGSWVDGWMGAGRM